MRFMVIVKATADSEAGRLPNEKELTEMGRFNEELVKAGVMLAGRRHGFYYHDSMCPPTRFRVDNRATG